MVTDKLEQTNLDAEIDECAWYVDLVPHIRRGYSERLRRYGMTPEDLAQDVWLRCLHERQPFGSVEALHKHLLFLCKRVVVDAIRYCRATRRGSGRAMLSIDDAVIAVESFETDKIDVRDVVMELPPRARDIVGLRLLGYTLNEIQKIRGYARSSVYRVLHQALRKIRTKLGIPFATAA